MAVENEAAGAGPVVLDIGGGIGALIVLLPTALAGTEIEISELGQPPAGVHTGVHLREVAGQTVPTAVFPALPRGSYQLYHPRSGAPWRTATVQGAQACQLDLRAAEDWM